MKITAPEDMRLDAVTLESQANSLIEEIENAFKTKPKGNKEYQIDIVGLRKRYSDQVLSKATVLYRRKWNNILIGENYICFYTYSD